MSGPQQPPQRLPAGATSDPPYGPLAQSGMSNPFFYHQFADDFDNSAGATGLYTVSKGSTGTASHIAGDGGLLQMTTAASNNDYVAIQLPAASVTLPQGTTKKLFYLVRLALSDITASAFVAGLCNTTATLFGGGSITDGVYFSKASGGTVLNLISAIGGVLTTTAVPTSAYSFTNAVNIDLAFYVDRNGNIFGFVGLQLVGWIPQSGSGAVNAVGVPLLPVLGPCMSVNGLSLSTANLNLSLGIQAGAAAAKSLTADFHLFQKER